MNGSEVFLGGIPLTDLAPGLPCVSVCQEAVWKPFYHLKYLMQTAFLPFPSQRSHGCTCTAWIFLGTAIVCPAVVGLLRISWNRAFRRRCFGGNVTVTNTVFLECVVCRMRALPDLANPEEHSQKTGLQRTVQLHSCALSPYHSVAEGPSAIQQSNTSLPGTRPIA